MMRASSVLRTENTSVFLTDTHNTRDVINLITNKPITKTGLNIRHHTQPIAATGLLHTVDVQKANYTDSIQCHTL